MSGRSQTILAWAGVAVLVLLVFFVLIRPRQGALGEVRDEAAAERDRTQQLEADLARLRALQNNAPRLQAQLDRIREFVPRDNDVSDFIFQVQEAATQAGVGLVQITPELPKAPPEGAALAEVRAAIGAKGGYFAVQDFLRRLYSLDRAVRVDGMTMTGVEDDAQAAEDGRVELQLTARIFFELPAGAAPAAATPAPAPATATTPTA